MPWAGPRLDFPNLRSTIMSCRRTLKLPLETMPALKGLGGQKVIDTEKITKTKVFLKRGSHVSAHIIGENWRDVDRAERILRMASKHYYASVCPLEASSASASAVDTTTTDIETFYIEVFNS